MLKIIEMNRMNIAPEHSKFTKNKKYCEQENMIDFVRVNTENNRENIERMGPLVEIINENLEKKLKHEGLAEGKFNLYLQEIKKREEVYSYAVSKLLENVNNLKESVGMQGRKSEAERLIENLE